MKTSIFMFVCLLAFTACKKENSTLSKIKKATQEVKQTANDVKNVKSMVSGLDDATALVEELKDVEPLSNDTWKNWMPENVETLKRKTYNIGNNGLVNVSSAKIEYRDTEIIKKSLKLEIIDGAGNGSGIIYMYKMAEKMKLDAESERGYDKIHKRDGITVKEKYRKQTHTNSTKMEFLANERFAVNTTGYNMEPDEMWGYLKALNFKALID